MAVQLAMSGSARQSFSARGAQSLLRLQRSQEQYPSAWTSLANQRALKEPTAAETSVWGKAGASPADVVSSLSFPYSEPIRKAPGARPRNHTGAIEYVAGFDGKLRPGKFLGR
eukprot:933445-Amphidinium_carterae.1